MISRISVNPSKVSCSIMFVIQNFHNVRFHTEKIVFVFINRCGAVYIKTIVDTQCIHSCVLAYIHFDLL